MASQAKVTNPIKRTSTIHTLLTAIVGPCDTNERPHIYCGVERYLNLIGFDRCDHWLFLPHAIIGAQRASRALCGTGMYNWMLSITTIAITTLSL